MQVLLRVASEVNLKSGPVKARFLRRLVSNIKAALYTTHVEYKVQEKWSRIFVEISDPAGIPVLTRVFGIGSVSPIVGRCEPNPAAILAAAGKYHSYVQGKTFVVRVKRCGGVEGFTSQDLERQIGALLLPGSAGVSLKRAQVEVGVEVRTDGAFFYVERLPGAGGLPLHTEGRALALISGGIDSPVASWAVMKRGVGLDFLFCNLAGQAYERAVIRIVKALADTWGFGFPATMHIADFSAVQALIREKVREGYWQVVLKKAMLTVGALVTQRDPELLALITGEAIGQVSSQTLPNMAAVEAGIAVPVLRPLISLDKEEIVARARAIGTYDLCQHIEEYCAMAKRFTVTQGNVKRVQEEFAKIPLALLEEVADKLRTIDLARLRPESLIHEYLYTSEVPHEAQVIDCRPAHFYQAWHYPQAEHMELDELLSKYARLAKDVTYVLYCPTGLQTAVVAEKMQNAGYSAYSFRGGSRALKKYADLMGSSCENATPTF